MKHQVGPSSEGINGFAICSYICGFGEMYHQLQHIDMVNK